MTQPTPPPPPESEPRVQTMLPPAPSLTFRLDAMKLACAYARAYRAKKASRP